VLLARAGTEQDVEQDSRSRDRDAPRLAASAAALADYLPTHRRDRGVGDPSSQTETDVTDIEEEMRRAAQSLNRANGGQPPPAPARYDFVGLANKVALAMVKAAEDQVTQAQDMLKEVQAWADGLTQETRDKDRELADMTDRIAAFGAKVLEANKEFHAAATVIEKRES
jgi:hypothetical protein